ncbi:hypothetical protein F2Q69_00044346 [Brassica cretica]|uniref:FAD/NAD(P)-binding domain-containing protein n=1 Tax=Brassica cretica TaxID=69181 RepID=A0A8S9NMX6_BRACR|nr:hypothetical protein F2Q69_00044346 [Brassica cretica]
MKIASLIAEYENIRSSKSVLIVGGGPSGVELAAEIAVDFPEKKVTLVHKGPRLLEFIGEKAADKAFDWLKSKKVEVILNQSVDLNSASDGNKTYKTSGAWMVKGEMVDEHLRIKDRKNVFTIGDITSILEIKQGYVAEMHANVAVKNIKIMMSGGEKKKKMSTYKPRSEMAIVSLGRKDSVAQFPFVTVIGCLPGLIKSKDLFVGKTRKTRGLNPKCVQVWSDCWLLLMLFDVSDDVLSTVGLSMMHGRIWGVIFRLLSLERLMCLSMAVIAWLVLATSLSVGLWLWINRRWLIIRRPGQVLPPSSTYCILEPPLGLVSASCTSLRSPLQMHSIFRVLPSSDTSRQILHTASSSGISSSVSSVGTGEVSSANEGVVNTISSVRCQHSTIQMMKHVPAFVSDET